MNGSKAFCSYIFEWNLNKKWKAFSQINKIHTCRSFSQYFPKDYINNQDIESPLWFTNLPSRKRRALSLVDKKKAKVKTGPIPCGPLVIECKNKELDHYRGMHYGKFDVIPLASKSWHKRKSKGDYFTILPTLEHPGFLFDKNESVVTTFEDIGVDSRIINQLTKMGIEYPSVVQAKGIPPMLQGENMLITAETGCGKTLAYLIPIIQFILNNKMKFPVENNSPTALIIAPTRELALQIGTVAQNLSSVLGIECMTMLGGHSKQILLNPCLAPVDILVCSLGVLLKTLRHNLYSMKLCKILVVDEADTLLDDSFNSDLIRFFRKSMLKFTSPHLRSSVPNAAQLCLVSATVPYSLESILVDVISPDSLHRIETKFLHKIQPHVPQLFKRVGKSEKSEVLLKLIKKNVTAKAPTMIFSNNTSSCNFVNLFLNENGIKSIRSNGAMKAADRINNFNQFQQGLVDVISCTDVTSRGIDCTRIKHVINFEFPRFIADYIHRCGRIGRLGHVKGCSVTNLISKAVEVPLVNEIEKSARLEGKLKYVNNNISRILERKSRNLETS